jgi:hypothetical protein
MGDDTWHEIQADNLAVTHVVLKNDEFANVTREQVAAERPVWQADL